MAHEAIPLNAMQLLPVRVCVFCILGKPSLLVVLQCVDQTGAQGRHSAATACALETCGSAGA